MLDLLLTLAITHDATSCQPDPAKVAAVKAIDYALATINICTQKNNYILQDGFKSFPSGHSSGTQAPWILATSTDLCQSHLPACSTSPSI